MTEPKPKIIFKISKPKSGIFFYFVRWLSGVLGWLSRILSDYGHTFERREDLEAIINELEKLSDVSLGK